MRLPRRASTLPGPTSTKRGAPASCRAMHGLAPAHGLDQRGGELVADVVERLRRSRTEKTVKRGLAELDLVERRAERRDGRLHRGRVERAGDVEPDARGGLRSRGDLLGARRARRARRRGRPGRARCRWRRSRRRASAISRASSSVGADEREHRAVCVGLGHQAAAQDDELERVVAVEHAGGDERGQLAERVPGGGARLAGRARPSRRRDAQKIAGCAKRVFSSTRAKGSSPTSSVTRSSSSGARWATRSRISGVWLPWPGKSAAGSVALLTPAPSPHTALARPTLGFGPTPRSGGADTP